MSRAVKRAQVVRESLLAKRNLCMLYHRANARHEISWRSQLMNAAWRIRRKAQYRMTHEKEKTMDISNLTSTYNDIYASASNQSASKLEGQLDKDYAKATDDELMDACKQFEAYFLEQVFKEMMNTIPKNEESDSTSNMVDYFKDEMIQNIATESTEQNSLGLAQMLYEQMKRNYGLEQ